ncbi:hypothetical protein [Desulfosudis oleivorans]|uniref:Uncharacterized protein n=1 Tax=Desulfosudis oleivorans (strain DSM 6200 / JCM 39069 / Hxd3) TaxID=96561 RepID=A8ZZZ8_DESOH|nr:hypothetical protein [Desulfosudis oleivorans]ABW67398.1 hypothetical protein Dole_1594 [Desulfosudis oleivorans Hxd3]
MIQYQINKEQNQFYTGLPGSAVAKAMAGHARRVMTEQEGVARARAARQTVCSDAVRRLTAGHKQCPYGHTTNRAFRFLQDYRVWFLVAGFDPDTDSDPDTDFD